MEGYDMTVDGFEKRNVGRNVFLFFFFFLERCDWVKASGVGGMCSWYGESFGSNSIRLIKQEGGKRIEFRWMI